MTAFEILHPALRKVLKDLGYVRPTSIQEKSIPLILRGLNVLVIAPTGSGKTEAALLPVMSLILSKGRTNGVRALYITPLRALNRDIFVRMREIADKVGLTIAIRHGDTPQSARRALLKNPPTILITTPETLQIMLVGPKIRYTLTSVDFVIVDELHELIESKRGVQLSLGLERLERLTGKRIQRIGLSATISDPLYAAKFLAGSRHVEVVVDTSYRRYNIDINYINDPEERIEYLRNIVGNRRGPILIFVNTRDTAEYLGSKITEEGGGLTRVHHGSLEREERMDAERSLRKGCLKALICTSSLELGIDVGHIELVIQYMSPRQAVRLAQRIGRSRHGPGRAARGIVLAGSLQDLLESAVIVARVKRGNLEKIRVYEDALDVLAHQLVGLALENRKQGVQLEDAWRLITRAYPYKNLKLSEIKEIIDFMAQLGYLGIFEDGKIKARKGAIKYYFSNVSMIPQIKRFIVIDMATGKRIGSLDDAFIASNLEIGDYFVLGGRQWRVEDINYEERILKVSPAAGEAIVPAWLGEDIPVSYEVSREVGALKRRVIEALKRGDDRSLEKLLSAYGLARFADMILSLLAQQEDQCKVVPSDKDVLIEGLGKLVVIHSHIGSKANYALGLLLSYRLSGKLGVSVRFRANPYGVILYSALKLPLKEVIDSLSTHYIEEDLRSAIFRSNIFRHRFIYVAKRFGVLTPDAERIPRSLVDMLKESPVGRETLREILFTKVDLDALRRFLEDLRKGRVHLHVTASERPTPLAEEMLEHAIKGGYVAASMPRAMLIKVVKGRLLEAKVKLLCLHCLSWETITKVGSVKGSIICPLCGSRLVAAISPWDSETRSIARKKRRGAKLGKEEERSFKNAVLSAKLVSHYGRRALLVLAGRGIGPQTAARILSRVSGEEDLIREIIRAEENYARTRRFWGD